MPLNPMFKLMSGKSLGSHVVKQDRIAGGPEEITYHRINLLNHSAEPAVTHVVVVYCIVLSLYSLVLTLYCSYMEW